MPRLTQPTSHSAASPTSKYAGKQALGSPAKVFLSCAFEDERYRAELETHLAPLVRDGILCVWHAGLVGAGQTREAVIFDELSAAGIIVLLVSSSFLADAETMHQTRMALTHADAGDATVIPVVLRVCRWKSEAFSHLMPLPRNRKPVTKWNDRDSAWVHVVDEICSILQVDTSTIVSTPNQNTDSSLPGTSSVPDLSRANFCGASELIRTSLAEILAACNVKPRPILNKAGVPRWVGQGSDALSQWIHACRWLSAKGISGIACTVKIISEVQSRTPSDALSRWSHQFVRTVFAEGRTYEDVRSTLHQFVSQEVQRWEALNQEIASYIGNLRLSIKSAIPSRDGAIRLRQYVLACTRAWNKLEADLEQGEYNERWSTRLEEHPLEHREIYGRWSGASSWPTAPVDMDEIWANIRTDTLTHADRNNAVGVHHGDLAVPLHQLSAIKTTLARAQAQAHRGRFAEARELSRSVSAFKLVLLDSADSGYFDDGELDEYANDLDKIAASLEGDGAMDDPSTPLSALATVLDWVEALLNGRLRNCG